MFSTLKHSIPQDFFLRLWYHKSIGFLAALIYGFPGKKLKVIGVTGTDGKTTTVSLLTQLLTLSGKKVGMASTVAFQIGEKKWINKTHKTTLGRFGLQKLLRQMVNVGCEYAVIEVSSHALIQSRLSCIDFTTAIWTNLAREHLDYHKTMEAYRDAKSILFQRVSNYKKGKRSLVIYGQSEYTKHFASFDADRKVLFGIGEKFMNTPIENTDKLVALDLVAREGKQFFTISNGQATYRQIKTSLLGEFNILNILTAIAAANEQGIDMDTLIALVPKLMSVPGRMESIEEGQSFHAIIDYAVTPQALVKCYQTLRAVTPGKIIAVLGACGDRDQGKRAEMGEIATKNCEFVILTNEEPYTENPKKIVEMLEEGAKKEGRGNYVVVMDRREAIKKAVEMAEVGDTVIVTGMGDQTSMVIGEEQVSWSDREVLREEIGNL